MCTVTWVHSRGGYELFCNRDEKLERREALLPSINSKEGIRFIAPIDAESGGTWIAVNELGVSICLLNAYPCRSTTPRNPLSRGSLIPQLISASSVYKVCGGLRKVNLRQFAAFTMVAVQPGLPACLAAWDGTTTLVIPKAEQFMPLASSSFDPAGVHQYRQREFRKTRRHNGAPSAGMLREFHASHFNQPSAYSTCMHRSDAQTVSFSHIRVSGTSVKVLYRPSPPCQPAPAFALTLARRR